jgi:hypothetical protein
MKRKQTAMDNCRWYAYTKAMTEEYDPLRMMRLVRAAIREAVRDATTCDGCKHLYDDQELQCSNDKECKRNMNDCPDQYTPRKRGTR